MEGVYGVGVDGRAEDVEAAGPLGAFEDGCVLGVDLADGGGDAAVEGFEEGIEAGRPWKWGMGSLRRS